MNTTLEYFKAKQRALLSAPETRSSYAQCKIDVESIFGHLKACLSWTRLSVRGIDKGRNEVGITLLAVNFKKLSLSQQYKKKKADQKWKNRRQNRISDFVSCFFCLFDLNDFYISVSDLV
ncbi:transposase [Enterococcus sp. AZ196]|uniref:transposase n=1 Tax=Enterococcus sp. AZ196 TaxID=2774659 RepID=UPI003D2829BE